ncbi:MAG: recombinase family protein, partial [Ruminiclostridium sp.]|nr:recombinase family protein [Ruminiclostridium sp.]
METIAACYIRVSTEDQTEYSPEAQKRALEHYARQHGMVLSPDHIYIDAGISGRRAETRPAFMAMIAAAKQKPPPFSVILVHKFDRFARNREDSIVYKSMLRRQCGVQVVSITEHLEDDRMSLILEAMLEAMAEYYSLNLAEEVRKG